MALCSGYKYDKEQAAKDAIDSVNAYYGIPAVPVVGKGKDITANWTEYYLADLDKPKFWYIWYHESLPVVLGQPSVFEVTFPPPSPPLESK